MFNRLPLDFVSDKVTDAPTDVAYSKKKKKKKTCRNNRQGRWPRFCLDFQDLATYLDIISSI